jgi:hypothetical protein
MIDRRRSGHEKRRSFKNCRLITREIYELLSSSLYLLKVRRRTVSVGTKRRSSAIIMKRTSYKGCDLKTAGVRRLVSLGYGENRRAA